MFVSKYTVPPPASSMKLTISSPGHPGNRHWLWRQQEGKLNQPGETIRRTWTLDSGHTNQGGSENAYLKFEEEGKSTRKWESSCKRRTMTSLTWYLWYEAAVNWILTCATILVKSSVKWTSLCLDLSSDWEKYVTQVFSHSDSAPQCRWLSSCFVIRYVWILDTIAN